ncbi:GtrA family protein [Aminobacter sp. AP02]|uniref:GtrA family protein n=1 Tax=Aminobacter sp. AP02 TaxID=2135737 RepID=UPI000D6B8273|nr:GtrA family protein [Aminobacter sp. AP02]
MPNATCSKNACSLDLYGLMLKSSVVRFAIVGVGATLTHLCVAAILLGLNPSLHALSVNTIAFCVAVFVSYLGHARFTFKRSGSAWKYFFTSVLGLLINNSIVIAASLFVPYKLLCIALGTFIAPAFVYLVSSRWVFQRHQQNG